VTSTTPAPPDAPVGLRERKKRQRRELLIDVTHRLVREHGLDGVTVEAICAAAGISPRTFFNYFESKDDAVLGLEPWDVPEAVATRFVEGGPTGDLSADLMALAASLLAEPPIGHDRLATAFELARAEPRLLAHHMAWIDRHKGQLASLVERRLAGHADGTASVEVTTGVLIFVTHMTFRRWEAAGGEGPVVALLPVVVAEMRGLLTTPDLGAGPPVAS